MTIRRKVISLRPARPCPPERDCRDKPALTNSSVRLREPEHALGEVAQHELARDRHETAEHGLAEVTLDVILAGIAETAVGAHRAVGGRKARIAGKIFRGVGLRAARFGAVIEGGGA